MPGPVRSTCRPQHLTINGQFMLAGMVREWAAANPASHAARIVSGSVAQSLRMATSLMQLIDHLDNGDISLADVPAALLNDAELPLHHEEAIGFLSIIAERYPAAMQERRTARSSRTPRQVVAP
jgi:inactivated superfamily I helicase